jgi:hypothetical protein
MEVVKDGEIILAIICRDGEWTPGLDFVTPDALFIQAGRWQYPAGKVLAAHRHKVHRRMADKTQEVAYVKRGRLKVTLFDMAGAHVRDVILEAGDFVVLAEGGHGYEILEDDTQVLEVKNGPFVTVEDDKEPV